MTYTTIIISATASISTAQKDFVIKSGFAIMGTTYSKSVKSSDLHIVVGQLASKNIPFNLKMQAPTYTQGPCSTCKR